MEMDDDLYTEAQNCEMLRSQITQYAAAAVNHGVSRDWANQRLNRLGAPLITGKATYQINVPIDGNYGTTVTATSRTEALEKFNQYVTDMIGKGEIRAKHCGEGVYGVSLTGGKPVFFSGPEDIEPIEPIGADAPVVSLETLRTTVYEMLRAGVVEQGWDHYYANRAAICMGLAPLPKLVHKVVKVPVSGTAEVGVMVFEGDDGDEAVQAATVGWASRAKQVVVTPDEIGQAFTPRHMQGGDMEVNLIDGGDGDGDGSDED